MRDVLREHRATWTSDPLQLREARGWLVAMVLDQGFGPDEAHDLAVAFSEACANVHRHAYLGRGDGRLSVLVTVEDARVVVVLDHDGRSFDPNAYPPPDLERPAEGGYGLYLIASLVDEVSYGEAGSGRRLVLVKHKRGKVRG